MWTHGSVTFAGYVVQVEEMKSVRRGTKPATLGWHAKIDVGGVEMVHTGLCDTQQQAERALTNCLESFAERMKLVL